MVKNKAFINISLLGLSLILSWSLIDYFTSKPNNLNFVRAQNGACEYVKWPGAVTNSIPVSYDISGPVFVTSSPIYVSGGKVGVNTKNPAYLFHVNGILFGDTVSSSQFCLRGDCRTSWPTGGGASYWNFNSTTNTLYPSDVNNYNVAIGTNNAGGSRLMVIGTTTIIGSASINQIGTNHILVKPTGPTDDRGIIFRAVDTELKIYRPANMSGWTVFRSTSSAQGMGFSFSPNEIDFSIRRPITGARALTDEGQLWRSSYGPSNQVRIGIGTILPQERLDVAYGNIRVFGSTLVGGGNVIADTPGTYPYGVVIKTNSSWGAWARQFAFIGPDNERLGAIIAQGSNPSSLNFIAIGPGIATSGRGEWEHYLTIRSSGNVGIGTTRPQYKLHVIGTTSVTALCLNGVCRSSWPTGGEEGTGTNYWKLSGNNLYVSSTNWKVGIGTNNPGEKLTVAGNVLVLPSEGWKKNGDTAKISVGDGFNYISSVFGKGLILGTWGNITFKNHTGESVPGSGKELMTITSDGRVGIGTANPLGKFDVDTGQGNMKFRVYGHALSFEGPVGERQDNLPYVQWLWKNSSDNKVKRAMYLGWGSVSNKYVEMTMENGYDFRWNGKDEKGNYKSLMVLKNYGYLGVNTLTPQYEVDVNGTVRASRFCLGSDCRSSWPTGTGSGTNYWRLTNNVLSPSSTNWYLGIGTAGEAFEPLHVVAQRGKGIYFYSALGKADLKIYESTSSLSWVSMLNRYGLGLRLTVKEDIPALIIKRVTTSQSLNPLAATSTGNEYANTVDAYVGIGTDTPAEKLHIVGNVLVQPAGGWSEGNTAKVVLGDGYNYLAVRYGSGLDVGSYHGKLTLLKTQTSTQSAVPRTILEISEE